MLLCLKYYQNSLNGKDLICNYMKSLPTIMLEVDLKSDRLIQTSVDHFSQNSSARNILKFTEWF